MSPRPEIDPPAPLALFVARLEPLAPVELWLFGSRTLRDARLDSDWDLLAVVADAAPASVTEPILAWELSHAADVSVTLLVTRRSDLAAMGNLPNTIGWDLAREGVRLRVG